MSTDAKYPNETVLEEMPGKVSRMGIGYNENEIILIIECLEAVKKAKKQDMFAATFPPSYIKKLIEALFEIGKQYQKEFGNDIGFGDIGED